MAGLGPDYDAEEGFDLPELAFRLGQFLYNAFAGLFLPAQTTSEQLARWTALPCLIVSIVGVVLLSFISLQLWIQGLVVLLGLTMFCYAGWVAHVLERRFERYEREADENPHIDLSDFTKRKRRR